MSVCPLVRAGVEIEIEIVAQSCSTVTRLQEKGEKGDILAVKLNTAYDECLNVYRMIFSPTF